jgi:hypothetical protein
MSERTAIVYLVDDDEGSAQLLQRSVVDGKCDVLPRRVGIAFLVARRQIRSETHTWFQQKLPMAPGAGIRYPRPSSPQVRRPLVSVPKLGRS